MADLKSKTQTQPTVEIIIGGDAFKAETSPSLVAARIALEFVEMMVELADRKGMEPPRGFKVSSGSTAIQVRTTTVGGAKRMAGAVREVFTNPQAVGETGSLLRGLAERVHKELSRFPDVSLGTRVGGGKVIPFHRAVPVDAEDSFVEQKSVRAEFRGIHSMKEGSRATFTTVLTDETYILVVSASDEVDLARHYKQELELELEAKSSTEAGRFTGRLLRWSELEGEGDTLERYRDWFKGSGWEGIPDSEIEKELGRLDE